MHLGKQRKIKNNSGKEFFEIDKLLLCTHDLPRVLRSSYSESVDASFAYFPRPSILSAWVACHHSPFLCTPCQHTHCLTEYVRTEMICVYVCVYLYTDDFKSRTNGPLPRTDSCPMIKTTRKSKAESVPKEQAKLLADPVFHMSCVFEIWFPSSGN